jgi:hypothetical protein
VAERLRAEAEAYGQDINNYAGAKLEQTLLTEGEEEAVEADDDLIAALREGLEQVNAGQLRTFEQVDEAVEAALAARAARPKAEAA